MSGYWRKRLELAQRKYRDDLARANRLSPPHFVTAYPLARLHARLGQTEEAFAVLDGCVRTRDELLVWLKAESLRADSPWTSIRSDARFTALLRRIGLERSDVPSGPSFAAAAKRP
jgi:predicted Fe-S protein YdhL (DUF1289 family)